MYKNYISPMKYQDICFYNKILKLTAKSCLKLPEEQVQCGFVEGREEPAWQMAKHIWKHSVVPAHYWPQVAKSRNIQPCMGTKSKSDAGNRGWDQHCHLSSGLLFFKIYFVGGVYMRMNTHTCVCLWRSEKCIRSSWSLSYRVAGSREPPYMGAGNWPQVVWKDSQHLPAQPSVQHHRSFLRQGLTI